MKTLEFHRDEKKSRVNVACADGEVSVYSQCAYCKHCKGILVGKAPDESLMNAAMMFNTLVRDGSAIECDDDANEGFITRY
jgi:hypothetical protein